MEIEPTELKKQIRRIALAFRREQVDKDALSQRITERVFLLHAYQQARCVMWYLDARDEVRTQHAIPEALKSDKRIVVPYCEQERLGLFHLEAISELETGAYKILEPRSNLRKSRGRLVDIGEVDLVLVPGVAFDKLGGRIGHGKGYYDKLLQHARPDTTLVGLAFECQMNESLPMNELDIFMDMVVTETQIYNRPRQ
ncbi:putative 5-formyltetrahydrofolate cyclo-ligase [Planctomycetes bacterium CA13]|uniref:5-formyltetrahydrofolate cyclo-ligase n=1 Tax=Novipirellula herctigrandis TaxID=2527986 RepID=A0A5C5YPA0_9BACT|nr:putative 5-formyltetrahydrofolate cyclo-ligase [Planctomycetes bacterium CA13]